MSETNTTSTTHDADSALDQYVSMDKAIDVGYLPDVRRQEHAPRSSPPPAADDDLPTAPTSTAAPDTIVEDTALDNDSEAETLISSPVKKREALKKANGTAAEGIERLPDDIPDRENKAVNLFSSPAVETQTKPETEPLEPRIGDAPGEAENGVAENINGGHSDEDDSSDVSSVQSFSDSDASSEDISM